jgi:hypothetical protein
MDVSQGTGSNVNGIHVSTYLTHALQGWGELVGSSVVELCGGKLEHPWKRGLWLLVVLPVVSLKLVVDGVCLLLDELVFPQAKGVEILKPVFVMGPPRSGTTFLHRVLAEGRDQFVTSPAWEVLLAPSILQKKFFRGVLSLDRKLGAPLVRLFRKVEAGLLKAFEDTHPGSLADPEEDYFYLSSMCACTGWILAFPAWKGIRKWMPGQPESSKEARREALGFYRRCLQKQLYVDGGRRTLLSKNASFSSWMDLFPEVFPDARFLICMRDPAEAVPSMLSTAEASLRGATATAGPNRLQEILLNEMTTQYHMLSQVRHDMVSGRAVVVAQKDLKRDLESVVRSAAEKLGLEFSADFWETLSEKSNESQSYSSSHIYDLADYGLEAEMLREICPQLAATPFHDPS